MHGTRPHTAHFNAPAAKSYLGLVAATPAHQGLLDQRHGLQLHSRTLAGTAFGGAQVNHPPHTGALTGHVAF
ncbi:hypothetical protein ACTU45_16740 [Streptomyces sp. 24-1644]|uniref:hypothetical protein n=1 Tax=Streptomyces sp. 24-1644 TaxID=3457315 RepID=UPI003FA7EEC1